MTEWMVEPFGYAFFTRAMIAGVLVTQLTTLKEGGTTDVTYNNALSLLMNEVLPNGILGVALAGLLATPVEEPELAVRQGKLLASRLLPWARSGHLTVPRSTDYVLAPTERGAIDNLRLTEADVPAPDEGYVQVRVEAAGLAGATGLIRR
jgi:hypothetical protein